MSEKLHDKNIGILNLMNEWTFDFILRLDSLFTSFQEFGIISFDIDVSSLLPYPKHFHHYFIFYNFYIKDDVEKIIINPFSKHYSYYPMLNDKVFQSFISLFLIFSEIGTYNLSIDKFLKHITSTKYYIPPSLDLIFVQPNNLFNIDITIYLDNGFDYNTNQRDLVEYNTVFYMFIPSYLRDSKTCSYYNKNDLSVRLSVGLLLDLSGYYKTIDLKSINGIMGLLFSVQTVDTSFDISYQLSDTKSNQNICLINFQDLIENDVNYIFIGSGMYNCMIKSAKILDESGKDVIVFYMNKSPGFFCHERYIHLGIIPNQYLKNSLFYFVTKNPELLNLHIIYNPKDEESVLYYESLRVFVRTTPTFSYFFHELSISTISSLTVRLLNENGVVLIICPTSPLLISLVDSFHYYRVYENNILCLLLQNEDHISYFNKNTLENFYLIDSIFSDNIVTLDYSIILFTPLLMDNKYTTLVRYYVDIVVMLYTGIYSGKSNPMEILYSVWSLCMLPDQTVLLFNNYLTRWTRIAKIYNNHTIETIFHSSILIQPEPYYYSNENKVCNFYGYESGNIYKIIILIDSQLDSVLKHFIFFFVDNVGSYKFFQSLMNYQFIPYPISTSDECDNYFNLYINLNDYLLLIVVMKDVCPESLLIKYDKILDKSMWIVSNYPKSNYYRNVYYSGLNIVTTVRLVLLQLLSITKSRDILIIIQPKWKIYYEFIKCLINENGMNIIFELISSDKALIISAIDGLIEKYPNGFHLFIEEDVELLKSIIKNVNAKSDNNKNGIFDYVSFIENPDYFIDDNYFIRIGTYLHKVTDSDLNYYGIFFGQLSDRFDNENAYPSIYISFYNSIFFWLETVEKANSVEYNIYRSYYYEVELKSMEGILYMNDKNDLGRHISIAYYPNGKYKEYKLGYYYDTIQYYTFSNKSITTKSCVYNNCSDKIYIPIFIALIVPFNSRMNQYLKKSIIDPFLLLMKMSHIDPFIYGNETYFPYFIISNYDIFSSNDDDLVSIVEKLNKISTISIVITNLDYITNIGNITKTELIIFNIGIGKDEYEIPIFSIGCSESSIFNEIYLNIMKRSISSIYILYKNKINERLISLFNSNGIMIKIIVFEDAINNKDLKDCYNNSNCVIINSIPCSESLNISLYLESLPYTQKCVSYVLYEDIFINEYYCSFINSYYVSGFVPNIMDSEFYIKGSNINEYIKISDEYFGEYYKNNPVSSYAYDVMNIYKAAISKYDSIDNKIIIPNFYFREYASASGLITFGINNRISRRLFIYNLIDNFTNTKIESNSDIYDSYTNLASRNVVIGLLLDFGGNEDTLSKRLILYADEIVLYINEIESSNNISFGIKKYSLNRNDVEDNETILSLLENEDISIIVGCSSLYCFDKFTSKNRNNIYNKIFLPLVQLPYDICNRYIIMFKQSLLSKLSHIIENASSNYVFLTIIIDESIEEENIKNIMENSDKNDNYRLYTYPFDLKSITFEEFYLVSVNTTILNLLSSDYLRDFVSEYLLFEEKYAKNYNQIFFNLDEYEIGIDLMVKLKGNYVCTTVSYETTALTKSDLVNDSLYISQIMLSLNGVLSIVDYSYLLALNRMKEENVDNSSLLIEYFQISSHSIMQTVTFGEINGDKSNYYIKNVYLSNINSQGRLTHTFQIGESLFPLQYSSISCNLGRERESIEIPNYFIIIDIILSILLLIIYIMMWRFLDKHKYSKIFEYGEIYLIKYIFVSGFIGSVLPLYFRLKFQNNIDCIIGNFLILIFNFNILISVDCLINWMLYCYKINEENQIKTKKPNDILLKILFYNVLFILFTTFWCLISPVMEYSTVVDESSSSYLVEKYYSICQTYGGYAIFIAITYVVLLLIGYTNVWRIKNFNHTNQMRPYVFILSWIGLMLIINLSLSLLLDYNNLYYYIISNGSFIAMYIGCSVLLIFPKVYVKYVTTRIISSSTFGTYIENEKRIVMLNDFDTVNDIIGIPQIKKKVNNKELSTLNDSEEDKTQEHF